MDITPQWVVVLPPVIAIVLAIATRQVYLSLSAGIFAGCTILAGWNPLKGLAGMVEEVVAVLGDAGNARVILFTLVIGALIATIEASGGVRGFVRRLEERRLVDSPRQAGLLVYVIGLLIFIESNITVLVGGAVGRPLFDRFRLSRERLAYLLDSTSAPVCMLIPLNAWGALVIRLLEGNGVENPVGTLAATIPLNFYSIAAVLLAGVSAAVVGFGIGAMRKADRRTQGGELLWPTAQPMVDPALLAPATDAPAPTPPAPGAPPVAAIPPRAINMILPVLTMVVAMPAFLLITGGGDIRRGSGSTSVLWSVLTALAVAWGLLLAQRAFTLDGLVRVGLRGAGGLVGLALILMLALALSAVAGRLGTGRYIAEAVVRGGLSPMLFLPLVFATAAVVAFCTGTSWGTFSLMMPMAIPAALAMGLPPAPFAAAVLSGGVFGDHASPISDTTIIASMAAATDHVDHVRTQLPYAMIAAGAALAAFCVTGATL